MLLFDPRDPYPLLNSVSVHYDSEKEHAAKVDAWLGLQTQAIELSIGKEDTLTTRDCEMGRSREFWFGKHVQTFSTPYTELRGMLEEAELRPHEMLIELGSGYARMAHVLARHYPTVVYRGCEMVRERYEESKRVIQLHRLPLATVVCTDVTALSVEDLKADIFFIYDFGSRSDIEIVIENLRKVASIKKLRLIARGGRVRDVVEKGHPWLSEVVAPLHRSHYSIYKSSS